jgi:hypothetical protein
MSKISKVKGPSFWRYVSGGPFSRRGGALEASRKNRGPSDIEGMSRK